jgi:flagellar export protein FliJ
MTSFHFRLQKVLDLRRTQLETEESRFKQQLAALAGLDSERAGWAAAGSRAETQVRDFNQLAGCDLTALGHFRLTVKQQQREIDARRLACQKGIEAQQAAMLEARRRCRLLERLKERRLAEWTCGRDHELEQLASESFMAKWGR